MSDYDKTVLAIRDGELSAFWALYPKALDQAASSGSCWPGINTIAVELGLSRPTVKRALAELCREELIAKLPRQRSNGGCTSNLYRLL